MFFNRFKDLCDERGISVYQACMDIGLNRSAVAKWKSGGKPNGSTAAKFAAYFGVTTDYLLGQSDRRNPEPRKSAASEEDIKFALFGGDRENIDAMYEEVKQFAAFLIQREAEKKE